MPHPYGYGGLAFYPGAGMMAGGFPAYTAPMYQVNRVAWFKLWDWWKGKGTLESWTGKQFQFACPVFVKKISKQKQKFPK